MEINNVFRNIPAVCITEVFETLFENKHLKLERIISDGHATPPGQWYDQDWDEWVVVLQGSAGIMFKGDMEQVILKTGDYLLIPAHKNHRVEWTDPRQKTIWLTVHMK